MVAVATGSDQCLRPGKNIRKKHDEDNTVGFHNAFDLKQRVTVRCYMFQHAKAYDAIKRAIVERHLALMPQRHDRNVQLVDNRSLLSKRRVQFIRFQITTCDVKAALAQQIRDMSLAASPV